MYAICCAEVRTPARMVPAVLEYEYKLNYEYVAGARNDQYQTTGILNVSRVHVKTPPGEITVASRTCF